MMVGKFYEVYAVFETDLQKTSLFTSPQNEKQMNDFVSLLLVTTLLCLFLSLKFIFSIIIK